MQWLYQTIDAMLDEKKVDTAEKREYLKCIRARLEQLKYFYTDSSQEIPISTYFVIIQLTHALFIDKTNLSLLKINKAMSIDAIILGTLILFTKSEEDETAIYTSEFARYFGKSRDELLEYERKIFNAYNYQINIDLELICHYIEKFTPSNLKESILLPIKKYPNYQHSLPSEFSQNISPSEKSDLNQKSQIPKYPKDTIKDSPSNFYKHSKVAQIIYESTNIKQEKNKFPIGKTLMAAGGILAAVTVIGTILFLTLGIGSLALSIGLIAMGVTAVSGLSIGAGLTFWSRNNTPHETPSEGTSLLHP